MGKLVNNSAAREINVACLGMLVLDVFGKPIDRFPAKGTSEYFDTLEIHPGGCTYNTGVDAGWLGVRVSVLGMLGADPFGDLIVQALGREGVNTAGACRSSEASAAFSFVMVPGDGQRPIYHTLGESRIYGLGDVGRDIVAGSKVPHVAGASLMPALHGIPTVKLLLR
jgi:sugar/nucleoside kinase (ribokinase family)